MAHDKTSWAPADLQSNLMLPVPPSPPQQLQESSGVPPWLSEYLQKQSVYQRDLEDYSKRFQAAIQQAQAQNARIVRLLASWVMMAPPRAHLAKTSGAVQNVGGANGTITYISWDSQEELGANFTHDTSTNNTRIQCDFDGRVHVKASVSAEQGGSARTTLAIYARVTGSTGSTVKKLGKHRNYSRGSDYGDISLLYDSEFDVADGDYIEIAVIVDDTDSSYTINTFYDECEIIVTRIG